ncbi:MAG: aldo/keto reductase [Hyphomicrobiaceae bacterium]
MSMRQVEMKGVKVVQLGLGTWRMGEVAGERAREVRALKAGLDLGMTLIDTAEMYGEGSAEEVVGEAIAGRRDEVFLVSKVYPHNASRQGVIAACARSLRRLGTDRIDLYLLHWQGSHPIEETVEGFEALRRDGRIGRWGVSNFDSAAMAELLGVDEGGQCAANQVLYHPGERGIEFDLLPECRRADIPIMAYSPLGQGAVLGHRALATIAGKHGVTPAAIALAFVMRHDDVLAIPKTSSEAHLKANLKALEVELDTEDLAALDRAFPPPKRRMPLAII